MMANPQEIIRDYRAMHAPSVGAKFYSQARLRSIGVPVPDFYCLSKHLFERLRRSVQQEIERIGAGLNPLDRQAVAIASAQLQALLHGLAIDPATLQAIMQACDASFADSEWVSVRACMVSASTQHSEDSVQDAFAGISESFLYVRRTELIAKIRACWASAYSEKALLYRLTQGLDPLDVSVAVGVQRMIFGDRSFVLFTCDPNTAARDTLLVAGYGIGQGVVQESVPVDHYFINSKKASVDHVIADKATMLSFDHLSGSGLSEQAVAPELRQRPCLSDAEIQQLHRLGQQIEAAFGWPQDIEGTFDASGHIHILQARPVNLDFTKKRLWTGLNVAESYPGVSSPLTYSVARLFYRVIFQDIYRRAGASETQLRDNHHRLDRMIGYIHGRIYYSLNAFYLLHGMVPIFPWLCQAWENMVGLKSSYWVRSGETEIAVSRWRRAWPITQAVSTFVVEFIRLPQRMRQYKRWWQQRALQARQVLQTEHDALALTEEFHRLWRDVGRQWGVTLVNDAYIFTLYAGVQALFKRWGLNQDPVLLSNLLCGDDEMESVAVFLSVLRLAEHVRADPQLSGSFLASDDAVLLARYRQRQFDASFLAQLDAHIERYGDRSMQELKLENPSLRDDPSVLIRGIRRFIKSDLNAAQCRQAELQKRIEGERMLEQRLGRWSARRAVLRWMLRRLREVIAHRENSRYCRSELFGICRDLLKAQAAHLVARQAIEQPADVFYLTLDEVLGYSDGTGVDESFHATVARRKAQLQRYAADDVAETLATNGALRNNTLARERWDPLRARRQLSGLGSSMGVARGRAYVVDDPHQVQDLPADTILVTRETDPGWLFLMLASTGIVVERGSMLSHTAITGRKFGIPTVVGVDDACQRIPHGAHLEIDGGSGMVSLLD